MYAITSNGFRAIATGMPLRAEETAVASLPEDLLRRIAADEARRDRSQLLRETDWTQMADAQLNVLQKAAMAAYRQALRDLPEQPGFPDCDWPVLPVLGDAATGAGEVALG